VRHEGPFQLPVDCHPATVDTQAPTDHDTKLPSWRGTSMYTRSTRSDA
jgi:hypothetical protein